MAAELRVLVLAGTPAMASLLISALHRGGIDPVWERPAWERVDSPDALAHALTAGPWDLVLVDQAREPGRALDVLADAGVDVPVIVVSASGSLKTVVDLVKRGAGDFVGLFELDRLPAAVERVLAEVEARREHRRHDDEMKRRANHDPLTGLPNRHLFSDRLDQTVKRAKRHGDAFSLLFIDLDHFKQVNDSLGHGAGDALLRQIAQRLSGCVRETDTVARLGGDEFTILVEEGSGPDCGETVARKVLEALTSPFMVDGAKLWVSASVGIATYPDDGTEAEVLIDHADTAMYRVKGSGRNGYRLYDPDEDEIVIHPPVELGRPVAHRQAPRPFRRSGWMLAGPALAAALLAGWFAHAWLGAGPLPGATPELAKIEPLRLNPDARTAAELFAEDPELDMDTAAGPPPCSSCGMAR